MFWHWIRRQYRKYGIPLGGHKAETWHNITTGAYVLVCWTLGGYVLIKYTRGKKPVRDGPELSPVEYYGSLLRPQKMEVIHIDGLTYAGRENFELKDFDEKQKIIDSAKDNDFFGE